MQQKINKGKELLVRQRKQNHEEEISQLVIQCMVGKTISSVTFTDCLDMKMIVEQSLKNIEGESSVPASASLSEELRVFRENVLIGQSQQFNIDNVPAAPPTSEGFCINKDTDQDQHVQPSCSAKPYIPTPPTSQGLVFNVENENLTDKNLQHVMDITNMEDYMGIGSCEMPQPSGNENYSYVHVLFFDSASFCSQLLSQNFFFLNLALDREDNSDFTPMATLHIMMYYSISIVFDRI